MQRDCRNNPCPVGRLRSSRGRSSIAAKEDQLTTEEDEQEAIDFRLIELYQWDFSL